MRVNLTRIAVAQLGCIFFCMGAAALSGKLAGMNEFPPLPIAAFVRNYGLLLTLVPITWLIASILLQRRRRAEESDMAVPFFAGWGLTAGFFIFGIWLTFSPMMYVSKLGPKLQPEQLQIRGQSLP